VSLAFHGDSEAVVGTANGYLVHVNALSPTVLTEQIGSPGVGTMIHALPGGAVIGAGTPPFQIGDRHVFLLSRDCRGVAAAGRYLCCLHPNGVSIFTVGTEPVWSSQLLLRVPGLVRAAYHGGAFCLVETPELGQSVVKYVGAQQIGRFCQEKGHRIALFRVIELDGRVVVAIGDDQPSIKLLGDDLGLVLSQETLGMPTATCVLSDFLVVARPGAVDFFKLKMAGGEVELDHRMTINVGSITPDLIAVDNFVIASDQEHSLVVFRFEDDAFVPVASDTLPKHLNKLCSVDEWIFASSWDSTVFLYELSDDGSILERGSFQCDSRVVSFCSIENRLFYGTVGGGIGCFERAEDGSHARLRDAIESDEITMKSDRRPFAIFQWRQPDIFVDLDAIGPCHA
jgi:hypothetical protein